MCGYEGWGKQNAENNSQVSNLGDLMAKVNGDTLNWTRRRSKLGKCSDFYLSCVAFEMEISCRWKYKSKVLKGSRKVLKEELLKISCTHFHVVISPSQPGGTYSWGSLWGGGGGGELLSKLGIYWDCIGSLLF